MEVDDRGVVAFSGHTWPSGRGWRAGSSWASQLSTLAREVGFFEASSTLTGVFSACSLGADGDVKITTDPLGLAPIYVGENGHLTAFSNRAALAAEAVAGLRHSPPRDLAGVGWLIYCGYLVGDTTSFSDIRTIPAGAVIERGPREQPKIWVREQPPWRAQSGTLAEAFDAIRDEMASYVTVASTLPADRRIADITGGRDSRLIAALLSYADLLPAYEFNTYGTPLDADVVVATEIATCLRLKHVAQDPGEMPLGELARQLRAHVATTWGMIGAWDLRGSPGAFRSEVKLSGVGGEILRSNYPGYGVVTSVSQLHSAFDAGMHFDALGVLRPEFRERYHSDIHDSLGDQDAGEDPLDVIDRYYLTQRLRRWFGTGQESDRSNRLMPLYSLNGLRAAFALGGRRRHAETVPFEVMRRSHPVLAKQRFSGSPWKEEVYAHLPDADQYRAAEALTQPPSTQRPWQVRRLLVNNDAISDILLGDIGSSLDELVDREALAASLDRIEQLSLHEYIQLYGVVTAALWMAEADKLGT
jgi:hypothetical protein